MDCFVPFTSLKVSVRILGHLEFFRILVLQPSFNGCGGVSAGPGSRSGQVAARLPSEWPSQLRLRGKFKRVTQAVIAALVRPGRQSQHSHAAARPVMIAGPGIPGPARGAAGPRDAAGVRPGTVTSHDLERRPRHPPPAASQILPGPPVTARCRAFPGPG